MKELKMFPQITEETEENLLNLEEEPKSPYSSTPPFNPSSSSSESPSEVPSSPNYENQVPCQLPTITTEDVDRATTPSNHNSAPDEEFATPPPRVRMRSLSGGAYRLAPTLPATGRMRRQSGDDVLTRVSPSRRAALFEHFRPRSKSDSKGKRPTFLTSLKNSIFSGGAQRKTSLEAEPPPLEPLQPCGDYRQRSRSGSETRGGTMSKMIDLFRSRSNSLSIDSRAKKQLTSIVPPNALLRRHSVDPDKRRRPSNTYRSLETHQGETYACHPEDETGDSRIDYGALDDDKVIPTFLSSCTCYDAMPKSGKVILLCTDLLVKNAFSILVTNEIKAAPLWDSAAHSFVGMLSISDFINVLRHYYYSSSSEDIKDIEDQKISTWRRITQVKKPFIKIGPSESLSQATKLLMHEGVHRLPVFEEKRNSVLFVMTRKRLLKYLYENLMEKFGKTNMKTPAFLKKTIGDLRIGTWENIAKITLKTKIIEALDLFVERNVSSLPVVDEDDRLIDIFAKLDVFALAKEQIYHNLDMTISEALDKVAVHEDAYGCTLDEPLGTVIDRFVTVKVHRLVVINEKYSVIGIISLSDILKFLVLRPLDSLEDSGLISTDTIDEAPEGAVGGSELNDTVFLGSETESSSNQQQSSFEQEHSDLSEDIDKLQIERDISEEFTEAATDLDESKEANSQDED